MYSYFIRDLGLGLGLGGYCIIGGGGFFVLFLRYLSSDSLQFILDPKFA